ncbi:MAG: hypothetical protein JNJ61_05465 [Anaerolineae bacterium]|nr:hypothetical protein [Anaerolineae bacterium]
MRKWFIALMAVLALTMAVGLGAVSADEETTIPLITDGRVNAWDVAAPVVVYCTFEDVTLDDGTIGSEMRSIDLYALRYTDGAWENVISVSAEEAAEALTDNDDDSLLVQSNYGYSFFVNGDDSLLVTAPADVEGKVYAFNWSLGDQNC